MTVGNIFLEPHDCFAHGYNVAFYAGYKHFSALTGEKKENMYKYDWCE